MKRLSTALVAIAATLVLSTTAAQAQSFSVGVGGGATLPMGDFNDGAKLGWHGMANVGYGLPSGLGFRGEFFYGQNTLDGVDGKTKLAGGMASLTYDIQSAGGIKPYVLGGVGYHKVTVDVTGLGSGDDSAISFGGGAGLKFKAGSDANFFVEARYINISTEGGSTSYIPVSAGISFGLGGK
jgi:opacity protein-like surface antigen